MTVFFKEIATWMYLKGTLNRPEHKLRRKNGDETRSKAGFSLFNE